MLDDPIEQITASAGGDDEKMRAWHRALVQHVVVPCDGFVIGELSLPEAFDGLLPWGHLDNRPYLRCLHGFGLCCWRLGRFEEAERVFERMLWLNPSDNQGVRFEIDAVRARIPWTDRPAEM